MPSRRIAVLGAAVLTLLIASPGRSQESRGTILGRLTDNSGAVVPGGAIQVTNIATGVTLKSATNEEGNYYVPFLIPGLYRITAEKPGFKRAVRDQIELNVNARLEMNLTLEVGAAAETITVTGEAPLLDTTNGSVGRVIDGRETRELPLNHGNPFNLIRLSGGVNFTDESQKDQPWQTLNTNYAMAGSRAGKAEITLDGASNTIHDQARGSIAAAWAPPSDIVAEFKIQTAAFDASTGQTEGGVVNISLKSGTNKLHGSAYWGKQATWMNANTWFANLNGQPRGDFKYNRLGGMISGPVYIPKLYNGKNKTFFLFSYEKISTVQAQLSSSANLTVPTAAQRGGDFSALLRLGANYQIYDPFTRVATANGRFTNVPLAGNIIPTSRISPVAKAILNYYLPPESVGTSDFGNNLDRTNWPSSVWYRTHVYKFDHNVSEKNRMMFRTNFRFHNIVDTDYFGFDNPSLGTYFWNESSSFAFDDVHSFTPTFVMDIKLSDSRFVRAQDSQTRKEFSLTSLGLPPSIENSISPLFRRFPAVTINGYTSLAPRTWLYKGTETREASVSFDKVHGRHDTKFGFAYRQYPQNQTAGSASTALNLSFTEAYTRGPLDNSPTAPRGQALASMLMGVVSGGSLTIPAATDYAMESKVFAGYVQNDWKVTRIFTLTTGLRYELETPITERYNRTVAGFDPTAPQPFEAAALANYAKSSTPEITPAQFSVKGGPTFAGVGGHSRGVGGYDKNNFMPRVGFAYNVTPSTVIRGGFGMYFGSLGTRLAEVIQTGFTRSTQIVPSNDGGVTFAATLANPFPDGFLQPRGAADGPATNVGNGLNFFNQSPKASRLYKFQVDVQRELPGRFLVELGYQSARDRDLEYGRSLSALPNQYLSTSAARDQATINYLSANLANPFSGIPQFNGTGLAGSVISRQALLSPFPQFSGVSSFSYDGMGWYDGLTAKLEKRFSRGYTVVLNYTFSKFIEKTTLLNGGDAEPTKVISDQDFPHHVSITSIMELPFGKGRKFGGNMPAVANYILGGWQFSPIYTYQSGPPLGFGNVILTGDLHDVPLSKSERTIYRWINTSVFNRDNAQQLGSNLRRLSPRFNGIRADAYNFWDASLLKNTRIGEKANVEFRFEALNVFNQVTFFGPNTTPNNTSFGQVTAQRNVPRHMQMTLRFQF
ncbi:MAG: carboxypeptidase-like regulatory domain-containing protein [Candidatus Solibacter sp.]